VPQASLDSLASVVRRDKLEEPVWRDLLGRLDDRDSLDLKVSFDFLLWSLLSMWHSGLAVRCWTCEQWFVDSSFTGTKLHNNLGQVVYTHVPLSPSSITWYWSKDSDVLRLGS